MTPADQEAASTPLRNVLFIMCDQLRWDALGCVGHPFLETPNIDALADRGVRFDRAFVNGAGCGSSRMSYYTGRYVVSHGARWNQVPLEVTQKTMGDHLRDLEVPAVLVGKTHMRADEEARSRLAIPSNSPEWLFLSECGFEPEEHDDGLHPDERVRTDLPYNNFLRSNGFFGDNPWHSAANSVVDGDGEPCSGRPQPLRRARGSTVLVALSDPPEGTRYSEHVIDAGDGAAHFSDADAACGRRRVTGRWMKSAPTPSKLTLPRGEDIATTVLTWAWAPRYGPVFVGSCEVTLADEAEEL